PRVVQDETGSCPYLRGTWLGTCEGVDTDPLRRYRLDLDQGACTLFMVQGGNNFRIGSPQVMPSSLGDRLTRAQWQDDARQVLLLMESWQQNEKSFQRRYEFNALTGQAQESLSLMGESAQNLLSCQYTKMK
ncbi:MAG: hypothetical protein NTX25_14190, partial [Proteobacteria bacterium]|nr:hypothetical protein [Pseudomonadota bacterium]